MRSSHSVLHLSRPWLRHETTINITKFLRVWARTISLCFVFLQTLSFSLLLPFFRGSIALHPPKLLLALSLLLRHTTPLFHSIPIGHASLAERPPSSRCIESAPEHRAPHIILLLMRASDTALGLLDGATSNPRDLRIWIIDSTTRYDSGNASYFREEPAFGGRDQGWTMPLRTA
jgi:hypothetical protein